MLFVNHIDQNIYYEVHFDIYSLIKNNTFQMSSVPISITTVYVYKTYFKYLADTFIFMTQLWPEIGLYL